MNIFDVLYARNTGRIRPRAKITDNLLGLALAGGGTEEKTIDFTPVISVSDAKAGNALDYQIKITATQTGTNPSPTNICPIDGWTGANIGHANGAVTIEGGEIVISYNQSGSGDPSPSNIRPILPGLTLEMDDSSTLEIYGATLNPVTGVLTNKAVLSVIDGTSDPRVANAGGVWFIDNFALVDYGTGLQTADSFTFAGQNYANVTAFKSQVSVGDFGGCSISGNKARVFFRDERFTTTEDLQAYIAIHPVHIVQEMAQAQEIQLSQTELARALTALGLEIIPVSWQTEAGTIYGGTLDFTTGELKVYPHEISVIDENSAIGSNLDRNEWHCNDLAIIDNGTGLVASDMYKYTGQSYANVTAFVNGTNLYDFGGCSGSVKSRVFFKDDRFESEDDLKAWLAQNPVHILQRTSDTPTIYTLTPTEITLAEGANTIWADCGDSKLTYLAKK